MNIYLFATIYLGVAAFVAVYVSYYGLVGRPYVRVFTFAERAMLAVAALVVSALWVLFIPGLAVHLYRTVVRLQRTVGRTWVPHRPGEQGAPS